MWGRLGWLGQANSSPTHRGLIADSWPTPRGLIADSSLTHRGLIADSSPTHRELIADSSPTYRGLIADSSRTHRGLIADSSPTHRGLIADSSPTHRRLIADSSPTHRGLIAESSPSWTAPWGNNPGPTLGTGSATWHSRPRLLPWEMTQDELSGLGRRQCIAECIDNGYLPSATTAQYSLMAESQTESHRENWIHPKLLHFV